MRDSKLRTMLAVTVLFLAWAYSVSGQETARGTPESSLSNLYDFGTIDIDAPMEHTFQFQNKGAEVLEVENVKLTPPLIVTKMAARVEPGSTGSVTVRLQQPRKAGEFLGSVAVNFKNEASKPLVFWAKGVLVRPIEFDPFPAFFVSTQRGEEKTVSLDITNHQKEPLTILSVLHNSTRYTTKLETLEEGRRFRLSLTLKGDGPAGRQTDVITIKTSDPEHPFLEVKANTNINERVYTFPPEIDFETISVASLKGNPKMADSFSLELTVYQKGGTDFQILSVQSDVPFLQLTPFQAQLKDRYGIRVSIIPEKLKAGAINGSVSITTNDPEFPQLTVPVKAMVEGSW